MCSSSAKKWIIGLLLLTAIVIVAAGYLMSRKPTERADKGTLVRAAENVTMAVGPRPEYMAGGCV